MGSKEALDGPLGTACVRDQLMDPCDCGVTMDPLDPSLDPDSCGVWCAHPQPCVHIGPQTVHWRVRIPPGDDARHVVWRAQLLADEGVDRLRPQRTKHTRVKLEAHDPAHSIELDLESSPHRPVQGVVTCGVSGQVHTRIWEVLLSVRRTALPASDPQGLDPWFYGVRRAVPLQGVLLCTVAGVEYASLGELTMGVGFLQDQWAPGAYNQDRRQP